MTVVGVSALRMKGKAVLESTIDTRTECVDSVCEDRSRRDSTSDECCIFVRIQPGKVNLNIYIYVRIYTQADSLE
jgi:hypothetical protein